MQNKAHVDSKGIVLYIGGFELPDKNAAAQRVIGIAKGLKELGYTVCFFNSVKQSSSFHEKKKYFGFECYENTRESNIDYLVTAKTCISNIIRVNPNIVIAYNYPGFALDRIRKYCAANNIQCYADATEWYQAKDGSFVYRIIKSIDTFYRMRIVQKKLDGVIAISKFLYNYYNNSTRTVLIPPTIDITDEKWKVSVEDKMDGISFVYAGSPSVQKECLDIIVEAIEQVSSIQNICLNILGITEEQFKQMYGLKKRISKRIVFWGRVDHKKAIEIIKQSDWSIIIRDNNRVVQAGFPTKLVESISCGTPVIINKFSNVEDYLKECDCFFTKADKLDETLMEACKIVKNPDQKMFDFHHYIKELEILLKR